MFRQCPPYPINVEILRQNVVKCLFNYNNNNNNNNNNNTIMIISRSDNNNNKNNYYNNTTTYIKRSILLYLFIFSILSS